MGSARVLTKGAGDVKERKSNIGCSLAPTKYFGNNIISQKKLSGYFVDNVNGEEIGRNRFAFQESCAVINYALCNYEMNNRIREIIVDIYCSPSLVSYD